MRSRLAEMQRAAQVAPSGDSPQEETFLVEDVDADFQAFLAQCDSIRSDLGILQVNVKKVAEKHGHALAAITDKQAQKNKQELEELMGETTRVANRVRKELKRIANENKNIPTDEEGTALARARRQQQNTLARQFAAIMTEYNDTQAKYKKKYRDRVTRQYKIVAPTATDEQVATAVDDALESGKNIFQDQILSTEHAAAQKALEEIEDRQKDIAALEKSMRELHELFLDLALLVDQQGEMLDRIEVQASTAADCVQGAGAELVTARKYQTSARKKKIAFMIILLIVLVIVAIIIWQVVK